MTEYVQADNGLILPEHVAIDRYSAPKGIDLFCGCGGFSLGLIQAGFEIVAAVEWEVEPAVTYMSNLCRWGEFGLHFVEESDRQRLEKYLAKAYRRAGFVNKQGELLPGSKLSKDVWVAGNGWISGEPRSTRGCSNFIFGDISKLTGERVLQIVGMKRSEVDCIVGGPPCQGFSTSGKKDPKDPRNNLIFEFIRLVLEVHPKTMCMENVPNIVNMTTADGLPIIDLVMRALEDGSFAAVDMVRKAISMQTGNIGLLRRHQDKKRNARDKRKAREMEDAE